MRKTAAYILSLLLLFALSACGDEAEPFYESDTSTTAVQTTVTTTAVSTYETTVAAVITTVTEAESTATTEPLTTAPPVTEEQTTAAPNTLITNSGESIALSALPYYTESEQSPKVYYTSDISSASLVKVYNALGWTPEGAVAVKLSTGEPPASNYLDPQLIKELVQGVNGTIVECNTAYPGARTSTLLHMQVAADHGFTDIANVDILDADGSLSIPVSGGKRLSENLVGSHFANYNSYIVLSHFKGHAMGGYGGAIKNISIGLGSREGKCLIHTAGKSRSIMVGLDQDAFLESMAEAGKAVSDYLNSGERIIYINVMNNLSVDCDCVGFPEDAVMGDIGILASTDAVALDQACVDLIYAAGNNSAMINRIESKNGIHTLEHAGEIGLGSRSYTLVNING